MAQRKLFTSSIIDLAHKLLEHVRNNDIKKAKVLVNLNALLMFIRIESKDTSNTEQLIYPLQLAIENVNIDMLSMFHEIISQKGNQALKGRYQEAFLNTKPAISDQLHESHDKISALKKMVEKVILDIPRACL